MSKSKYQQFAPAHTLALLYGLMGTPRWGLPAQVVFESTASRLVWLAAYLQHGNFHVPMGDTIRGKISMGVKISCHGGKNMTGKMLKTIRKTTFMSTFMLELGDW